MVLEGNLKLRKYIGIYNDYIYFLLYEEYFYKYDLIVINIFW